MVLLGIDCEVDGLRAKSSVLPQSSFRYTNGIQEYFVIAFFFVCTSNVVLNVTNFLRVPMLYCLI